MLKSLLFFAICLLPITHDGVPCLHTLEIRFAPPLLLFETLLESNCLWGNRRKTWVCCWCSSQFVNSLQNSPYLWGICRLGQMEIQSGFNSGVSPSPSAKLPHFQLTPICGYNRHTSYSYPEFTVSLQLSSLPICMLTEVVLEKYITVPIF